MKGGKTIRTNIISHYYYVVLLKTREHSCTLRLSPPPRLVLASHPGPFYWDELASFLLVGHLLPVGLVI